MIDWHSHVLPGMDDGSQDVAESLAMIEMQSAQGVDIVIATPHFYANDESVDSFLNRRQKALDLLMEALPEQAPEIIPGAEVRYYQGISRMPDLKRLRIGETKLLLLEMPMCRWTEYMVRELVELSAMSGIRVILAHIDRYWHLQSRKVWDRIFESGLYIQVNASFFNSLGSRHKAFSLLQQGNIHFVGSDCHNMTSRSPQIGKAFAILQKRLGQHYVSQMNEYGYGVLGEDW